MPVVIGSRCSLLRLGDIWAGAAVRLRARCGGRGADHRLSLRARTCDADVDHGGVGRGAGHGILIKDAAAIERMEKVDTLVVDKTGTLTEGALR